MTIFYRHDIIYQQLTTGWEHEEAVVTAEDPLQSDTPVVRRPDVFYSDINNPVPDEVAVIESGWDQAFLPPLVVHKPVFFPRTEEVLDEIAANAPGWEQAYLPPLVLRKPVFYSDLNNPVPDEIAEIGSGWDQPAPPIVLRPPVFFPRTEEVLDEIAIEGGGPVDLQIVIFRHPIIYQHLTTGWETEEVIVVEGPGWDQPAPPIVLPRKIPPSTSVGDVFDVLGVVEGPGWDQASGWPVIPRIAVHYADLSNPVPDEIAEIGSGWEQAFLPPLVLPRDSAFFLPSENNPVLGPTTIELTYTLDAILGPLAPPGLRLKELRLKELRLKELRRRFIRRD